MQRVVLLPWPTAEAVTEATLTEHALYDAKPSGFTLSRPCASCTDIGGAVALMRFSRHLADNISRLEAEVGCRVLVNIDDLLKVVVAVDEL